VAPGAPAGPCAVGPEVSIVVLHPATPKVPNMAAMTMITPYVAALLIMFFMDITDIKISAMTGWQICDCPISVLQVTNIAVRLQLNGRFVCGFSKLDGMDRCGY
jgi:hypothetical protein